MTKFDSQNGWIQIVFANEEDSYVLPSMISVNYQRFLFYCLKKAGYEAVYFWGDNDSKYELFFMDNESAQYYEKVRPKGALERILGSSDSVIKNEEYKLISVRISNENIMEQIVYEILKGKKKTALVIPMKVFDAFFSKVDRANTLVQKYKEQKSNKNLLLITASVRAEDSNKYIIRENGILSKLFEEVRQAVIPSKESNIYESLQMNMGDKSTYLNDLNREMIRNVVRKQMILYSETEMNISSDMMERIAMVYEWYYQSRKFRENTPIMLPENKKRELKVIEKSLSNMRTFTTIYTWIEDTGDWNSSEGFRAYLKNMYPKDAEQCFIYTDNFLLRLWEQIIIPESMLNMYQKSLKRKIEGLTERLRAVILRNDEDLDKVNFDTCMEQMKKSVKDQNADSLRHAMNSVEFLLDNVYDKEAAYREIWPFYQELFELSNEINKLKLEVEDNQHRMNELEIKFRQYDEKYMQSKQMPGITDAELEIMVKKILQCDEERTMIEHVKILKENQIHQYEDVIETIEQAIQSARGDGIANVQGVYEQAITMQNKMLDQSFQTIKEVEKIKQSHPDFKETTGMSKSSSLEELEDQYRVLAARMQKL